MSASSHVSECGGRMMRCGPERSGRMRRTCKVTCSQAPKDERGCWRLTAARRTPSRCGALA